MESFEELGLRLLSWVLAALFVAAGQTGVAFHGTFFAAMLVLYFVAKRPPPLLPEVPDGIAAPGGRPFEIHLLGAAYYVRVGIKVRDAAAFSLERENYGSRLESFFAGRPKVTTGYTVFDETFRLEGPRLAPEARQALVRIFDDFGARRVRCVEGSLFASVPLRRLRRRSDYEILLRLLDDAGRAIERVAIDVKVLGGERRALVGHGSPRCAYCHSDVTGSEPDLVACATCSTVLHEGCWGELGRCPVLGCRSASLERAGSRA